MLDKAFYSLSWQLGRRTSNLQDLLNTDALALERVGVSSDSVGACHMLNPARIPLTNARSELQTHAERIVPLELRFLAERRPLYNVTMNGRWNGQDATNLSTTAVPDHGGDTRSYGGTLQAATRRISRTTSSTTRAASIQ